MLALWFASHAGIALGQRADRREPDHVRPGVDVLLDEQVALIRARRIVLVVGTSTRDEHGERTDVLLTADRRARAARVSVVDTVRVDDGSPRSDVGIDSVAGQRAGAAVDAIAAPFDEIVVDVQDRGLRDGPAAWVVRAILHSASRRKVPVIVLDRPNPLTAEHAEGPAPDSAHAAIDALYGLPSRHGMTLGEIAQWFNASGGIGASLTVVPVRGWRRSWWPTDHGGHGVRIGGDDATAEQEILAGAFAPFEATSLDVARGPGRNVMRIGAPWLDADRTARTLMDRLIPGVQFSAAYDRFTDSGGREAAEPDLRIELTDRDRASAWRIAAAVLATVVAAHRDSLVVDAARFDRVAGNDRFRTRILAGEDSDTVVDAGLAAVIDFSRRVRSVLLYR